MHGIVMLVPQKISVSIYIVNQKGKVTNNI